MDNNVDKIDKSMTDLNSLLSNDGTKLDARNAQAVCETSPLAATHQANSSSNSMGGTSRSVDTGAGRRGLILNVGFWYNKNKISTVVTSSSSFSQQINLASGTLEVLV